MIFLASLDIGGCFYPREVDRCSVGFQRIDHLLRKADAGPYGGGAGGDGLIGDVDHARISGGIEMGEGFGFAHRIPFQEK